MRAEFLREGSISRPASHGRNAIAELLRELNSQVSQPADSQNRYQVGSAPLWRRALNVVTPAHMRGAASAASSESGIDASAATGATMYS